MCYEFYRKMVVRTHYSLSGATRVLYISTLKVEYNLCCYTRNWFCRCAEYVFKKQSMSSLMVRYIYIDTRCSIEKGRQRAAMNSEKGGEVSMLQLVRPRMQQLLEFQLLQELLR